MAKRIVWAPQAVADRIQILDYWYKRLGTKTYAQRGRWMGVDPLADKYPGWNAYSYVLNNPLRLVDPDGRAPSQCCVFAVAGTARIMVPLLDLAGVTVGRAKGIEIDTSGDVLLNESTDIGVSVGIHVGLASALV